MHQTIDFVFRYGYTLLVVWIFAEQLGVPIPSIPVLLAAGALAGTGQMSLGLLFVCVVLAAMMADLIWYQLGIRKGHGILRLLCRISLEPDSCVRRTAGMYVKRGARSLLVAKFVPGLNAVSTPMAGILHMSLARFLVFDVIGTVIWASVLLGTGYVFSSEIEEIAERVTAFGGGVGLVLAAVLAGYLLYKYAGRRRFLKELRTLRISAEELKQKLDGGENPVILDLRTAYDFEAEPEIIPGAVHMDAADLGKEPGQLPPGKEVILYCT